MKTLYFECNMGAAGDMLCAALADLFDDKSALEKEIADIGLPSTTVTFENKISAGVSGLNCKVICNGEEESSHNTDYLNNSQHRSFDDVKSIVSSLNLSENTKTDILNIYNSIAEAESRVHGVHVSEVHFHELGMLDAVADITVFCFLMNKLGADNIISSPINVGNGSVKCAHGILPVPAPAAAEILIGVPFYKSKVNSELCTPTGAAILKYFVKKFTDCPSLNVKKIGVGVGKKEFSSPNILRTFLCYEETNNDDIICEISCNIDDMTGEEISYACESLFLAGALDVFTSPIYMKKSRPAVLLTVICKPSEKTEVVKSIFKNTKTLGVREHICSRHILNRESEIIETPYGEISVKHSEGYSADNVKVEYESIKQFAEKNNMSFLEAENFLYNFLQN